MKTRESGMPPEEMWSGFFDPSFVLRKLGLNEHCWNVLEFGCGYGTFTIPAARMIQGTLYALDIDAEMLAVTTAKARDARLTNVRLQKRDFVEEGSGLADGSVGYVMLFNILHAEERMEMLREAYRVLSAGGLLAVMHWNHDPTTPRGPSMNIRPRPEDCRSWAEQAGFIALESQKTDLPPYHYGFVFEKPKADAA